MENRIYLGKFKCCHEHPDHIEIGKYYNISISQYYDKPRYFIDLGDTELSSNLFPFMDFHFDDMLTLREAQINKILEW